MGSPQVGSSNGVIRKHPWVTYALALLMLGSFGYQRATETQDRDASAAAVEAAVEFFEANPDVQLDPRFSAVIGLDYVRAVREEDEARHQEMGLSGLRGHLRTRTQRRYQALEREALARLDALPAWRFGVSDSQTPAPNYLAHAFVHEQTPALLVSLVFFLLAGLALETAWGSLLFLVVCALGCVTGAAAHVALYGRTGSVWIGASGLVGTLLGAYFVRAFRGFVIPGWVLLPAWAALEYSVARGIWIENFRSAPVNAHLACLGAGAVFSVLVWLLGLEERRRNRRGDTADLVANPVVDRALQAKQEGKLEEAFRLLDDELKHSPGNRDAAVALWDVAVGMGRAAAAGPAMLSLVRGALRRGDHEEAVRHWVSLFGLLPDVEVEAAFAVRMGEALLDQGHPDEALRTLCKAVDGAKALSSALAMRVVRISRDLDPDLTRRAAGMALRDTDLDPSDRARLQTLLDESTKRAAVGSDRSDTDQTDAMPPPSEPRPAAQARASSRPAEPSLDPFQDPRSISAEALEGQQPVKETSWEFDDYQDPHSISAEALDQDSPAEREAAAAASRIEVEGWNSPGMLKDLSDELSDDEAVVEMDLDALDRDHLGQSDEDTESHFVMPAQRVGEQGREADCGEDDVPARQRRGVGIDDDTAVEPCGRIRRLKVRNAVPVALEETGIAVDVPSSGKTTLPYDRIDALSVAAVERLSQRAVIVVDAVLNWLSSPDEVLKTIRFRSDEFDPCALAPGARSPIDALRAALAEMLNRSGARPLPDAAAARGKPFATYPDLDTYERAVLMADAGDATSAGGDPDAGG